MGFCNNCGNAHCSACFPFLERVHRYYGREFVLLHERAHQIMSKKENIRPRPMHYHRYYDIRKAMTRSRDPVLHKLLNAELEMATNPDGLCLNILLYSESWQNIFEPEITDIFHIVKCNRKTWQPSSNLANRMLCKLKQLTGVSTVKIAAMQDFFELLTVHQRGLNAYKRAYFSVIDKSLEQNTRLPRYVRLMILTCVKILYIPVVCAPEYE